MNEKSKTKWSRNARGESCLFAVSSSVIYTCIHLAHLVDISVHEALTALLSRGRLLFNDEKYKRSQWNELVPCLMNCLQNE